VPYDPVRDFVPISLVTSSPSLITVHPSLPVRSVKQLVALAKSKPGQLNYSAAGIGTNPHIAGELFNLLAGVNIVAVQFKGGGPADMAVIAGEIEITFGNISQQVGYINSGRLRALAVTSLKRSPAMPDLPTVDEAGVPGYEFVTWHGVLAPRGTPLPVVDLLNQNLKKVLTAPGEARLWQERGLDVIASSPEEFAAHIEKEQKKWGKVIKERGIKAE
jgi:tripartite-type tricarboxylate transporter receptor subunit TctC